VSFATRTAADGPERQLGRSPRHQLVIERHGRYLVDQVRPHAPVWLERLNESSLAPLGFGADLRRAIQQRCELQRARERSGPHRGR
jgi:hypothetical protein